MFSLSLWRGSRLDSSAHTTSTNTTSNSHTTEALWTPSGQFKSTECVNTSIVCSELPETKQLIVQAAVTDLFEKDWFDICVLDKLLKIIDGRKSGKAYDMLRLMHCVHYDRMAPELRDRIPHLVNECLRQKANTDDAAVVALQGVIL